jgi:3-oxoacyl-[acyl-carrier protein] reductase
LNAADQGLNMKIFENPLTDFMRVLNTNIVWNYAFVERAALRMKQNGGGSVVFINSNTAYRAIPDRIAYEASKGGQLGMMRGLALDLGKYNIRVNAVLPGMIKTDRWEKNPDFYQNVPSRYTPLQDVAVGADVADAVWYFAVGARNTTGAELVVDGGNMIQLYPIIPKE